jgi:hypothetical protein
MRKVNENKELPYYLLESIKKSLRGENMKEVEFEDFGDIPFGKFKGTEWMKLDADYLEFLCKAECKIDERFKKIARRVIMQKKDCVGQGLLFEDQA